MEIKQSAIERIQKDIRDSDNDRLQQYFKEFLESDNHNIATILGAWKFLQYILNK